MGAHKEARVGARPHPPPLENEEKIILLYGGGGPFCYVFLLLGDLYAAFFSM